MKSYTVVATTDSITQEWLLRHQCILNALLVGGIFLQQSGLLMSWEESPDQILQAGKPILPGELQHDYTTTTRWAAPLIWTQLSLLCLLKSFPSHENVITRSQRAIWCFKIVRERRERVRAWTDLSRGNNNNNVHLPKRKRSFVLTDKSFCCSLSGATR